MMHSPIYQIENGDKRMCVYSQRDFEYMTGKGWKPVAKPCPPAAPVEEVAAKPEAPKKRGRPAKVNN